MANTQEDIDSIVKASVDFHGHLGPFLVVGVRMALIGLRELGTVRGDPKLEATTIVKRSVPFSCTIDGIQVATQCTVGNGKLKLGNVKGTRETVSATFKLNRQRQVTVTLKPAKFEQIKKSLPEHAHSYKNIQLARQIASSPENELFTIQKK